MATVGVVGSSLWRTHSLGWLAQSEVVTWHWSWIHHKNRV